MHSAPQAEHLQANKRHGVRLLFDWMLEAHERQISPAFDKRWPSFQLLPAYSLRMLGSSLDAMIQLARLARRTTS
jgi:hypothetical protein